MKIYQTIPSLLQSVENCENGGSESWGEYHAERLALIMDTAPHGSGFDIGTEISEEKTTVLRRRCGSRPMPPKRPERLVFTTAFHHMSEHGYYDGWTHHDVIVTPSLAHGFDLRITGRNRNDIKDYMHDVFSEWLDSDCGHIRPDWSPKS